MQTPPPSAGSASDAPPDWIGRKLADRYTLAARVGEGGIGVVYRAVDQQTGTDVAVKLLRDGFSHTRLQRRFAREAKALAALRHPNIVSVLDADTVDDTPYLVMELLQGRTLADALSAQPLWPVDQALGWMRQLLAALDYVHSQGLVHRDLKPANVFLQELPDGSTCVKLLDFGLAKFFTPDAVDEHQTVTRTGDIFGTLGYMPPEQAVGEATDTRADVYSAGAILFELLTGRRAYVGEGTEVLQHQLTSAPPTLSAACPERVPSAELEALVQQAMALKPADRYPDAAAFSAAFSALPEPPLRAPTADELAAIRITGAHGSPLDAASMALAPTLFHEASIPLSPWQRLVQGVRDLVRAVLLAGAWVLSGIAVFVLLVGAVLSYLLFGSDYGRQQKALRAAMPDTVRDVLDEPAQARAHATKSRAATTKAAPAKADTPRADTPSADEATETDPAERDSELQQDVGEAQSPTDGAAVSDGGATSHVSASSPWRRVIPSALRRPREKSLRGWSGDERTIAALRRYNREQPTDARGHLVLATLYMNRKWYADAVAQYGFALQRQPSSRGDQAILRDLITLVGIPATTARASDLVTTAYGAEATDTIAKALAKTTDPGVRGRLDALQQRIAR